jgi:hypothetical protein
MTEVLIGAWATRCRTGLRAFPDCDSDSVEISRGSIGDRQPCPGNTTRSLARRSPLANSCDVTPILTSC